MNEVLADREKALQQTFAQMEAVISRNNEEAGFVAKQAEEFTSSVKSGEIE